MKVIVALLVCFMSIKSFAQIPYSNKTKQFINDFFAKDAEKGILRFKPYIHPHTIDILVNFSQYWNIDSNCRDSNNNVVIFKLTQEEKELIRDTWLRQLGKAWDSSILEKAAPYKRINFPVNASREEKIKLIESYQQKTVVSFTNPVFLRNNRICVFFYTITYDIMHGGGGELVILKRKDEKWEKYLVKTLFIE